MVEMHGHCGGVQWVQVHPREDKKIGGLIYRGKL